MDTKYGLMPLCIGLALIVVLCHYIGWTLIVVLCQGKSIQWLTVNR